MRTNLAAWGAKERDLRQFRYDRLLRQIPHYVPDKAPPPEDEGE